MSSPVQKTRNGAIPSNAPSICTRNLTGNHNSKGVGLPKDWLEKAGMKENDGVFLCLVFDPVTQRHHVEIYSVVLFNYSELAKTE